MFERNKVDTFDGQAVEITFAGGAIVTGRLVTAAGRSLGDVLNGPGDFVDFEPFGGERSFVAKSTLLNVKPMQVPRQPSLGARLRDGDGFDPHAILGVLPTASPEEVTAAWRRLAKTYHPDRYMQVDLPVEVREFLDAMARRINAAHAALEGSAKTAKQRPAATSRPIYTSGSRV